MIREANCPGIGGAYPYPGDCTKYIVCPEGRAKVRKCPHDLYFDSRSRRCVPPKRSDCVNRLTVIKNSWEPGTDHPLIKEDFHCPEPHGNFPYPGNDCHKYISCVGNLPEVKKCPEQHVYRQITGCIPGNTCNEQEYKKRSAKGQQEKEEHMKYHREVNSRRFSRRKDMVVQVSEDWECAVDDGLFPFSDDCTRYFLCHGKKLIMKACPVDMSFNVILSKCIYGDNPACHEDNYKLNQESDDTAF